MSEHELPQELSGWPTDPYRLLGVRYGVSPRDLRRAYLSLVRRFKPEHSPEHFRRIREAYETVLAHSEAMLDTWSGGDEPGSRDEPVAEIVFTTDLRSQRLGPRVPGSSAAGTTADDLWERACCGEEAEAYRILAELQARNPWSEETCLQLYWLLVALPELDPKRTPCDWLASGLRANNGAGHLWMLYQREVAAVVSEALSERCAALVRECVSPAIVLSLVEHRWRAAGDSKRWEMIIDDLASLRTPEIQSDEGTWARILLAAATQLAWGNVKLRETARTIGREIESLHLLDASLEEELARLDFQFEVAAGWAVLAKKQQPALVSDLVRLTRTSWNREPRQWRSLFISVIADVARDPRRALTPLDRVRSKAPAVFGYLASLLDEFANEVSRVPDRRTAVDVARTASTLRDPNTVFHYGAFRSHALEFCVDEVIAPDVLARALLAPEIATRTHAVFAAKLQKDWPLRFVYSACAVYADL